MLLNVLACSLKKQDDLMKESGYPKGSAKFFPRLFAVAHKWFYVDAPMNKQK